MLVFKFGAMCKKTKTKKPEDLKNYFLFSESFWEEKKGKSDPLLQSSFKPGLCLSFVQMPGEGLAHLPL